MTDQLRRDIKRFQEDLPYRSGDFAKKNWGQPLHSLCSYQGKLKPAMAHTIIEHFVPPQGAVLDPLAGVGTIPFEAALTGRSAIANDLSPLAATVSKAKMDPPDLPGALKQLDYLADRMQQVQLEEADFAAAEFGLNARVVDYFHPGTLDEVLKARRILAEDGVGENSFVWASVLHILHGNRPYALSRTSHPITPFSPTGEFVYKSLIEKTSERIHRALKLPLPESFLPGAAIHGDFRDIPARIDTKFDAVVTSPPFMGMRFDRPNWLRLWFCGWDSEDFKETSLGFLERQQTRTREPYTDFFEMITEVTLPGALVLLHIGSGGKTDLVDDLRSIGSRSLEYIDDIVENVEDVATHGVKDRGRTTKHHLLIMRRG